MTLNFFGLMKELELGHLCRFGLSFNHETKKFALLGDNENGEEVTLWEAKFEPGPNAPIMAALLYLFKQAEGGMEARGILTPRNKVN